MVSDRRTHTVNFRLTDAEFQELVTACRTEGAHSLSEFSRAAVLQMIETSMSAASTNQTLRRIERMLQAMQSSLQQIRRECPPADDEESLPPAS